MTVFLLFFALIILFKRLQTHAINKKKVVRYSLEKENMCMLKKKKRKKKTLNRCLELKKPLMRCLANFILYDVRKSHQFSAQYSCKMISGGVVVTYGC